jgi:hypothetical protein
VGLSKTPAKSAPLRRAEALVSAARVGHTARIRAAATAETRVMRPLQGGDAAGIATGAAARRVQLAPAMRDDDILIHRRPPQEPRDSDREQRSVVRDDDIVFRRRRLTPEPGPQIDDPHR